MTATVQVMDAVLSELLISTVKIYEGMRAHGTALLGARYTDQVSLFWAEWCGAAAWSGVSWVAAAGVGGPWHALGNIMLSQMFSWCLLRLSFK